MKLQTALDIYNLIANGSNSADRVEAMKVRMKFLSKISDKNIVKIAFDTRKINQETDYIPRRGLQNYHRSEKFISEAIAFKVQAFTKLSKILENLKNQYGREPEWQDSYTRVLHSTVNKNLIIDGDEFSDTQPSMTSLGYLEELMYVRYRLTPDNLNTLSEVDLTDKILSKDELLVRKGYNTNYVKEISPSDVSKYSYDQMIDKMLHTMAQVMSSYKPSPVDDNLTNKLFDVKATKDNPEVERTVTITIKDKIGDKLEKLSSNQPADNELIINSEDIKIEE